MSAREPLSASPAQTALPKGVSRACEAMRAAPARDFDLAELAALTETPARTLQRQFSQFLGKSPLEVLRDIRFEAARRRLLGADPDAKVTEIAASAGLTHFGRFSIEYRRRYGEKPSDTLARNGRAAAALRPQASTPSIVARSTDGPAIAVLPVEGSAADKPLAEALGDAFAAALVRAGTAVGPASGARYRLASALRSDGARTRLSYRLLDAESGRLIWAHRQDGFLDDTFAFEDRVATQLAASIQPELRTAEIARARAVRDCDAKAYDLALKALPDVIALDGPAATRALSLLERAMEADPGYAFPMTLAAWCHAQRVIYRFAADPHKAAQEARSLAQRAIAQGCDATGLAVLAAALTGAHDLDSAAHAADKALAIDGGSTWAWSRMGWIDVYRGDSASAVDRFATALDLAPHDPLAFNTFVGLGCAYFELGRYADAARWLARGVGEHPSAAWAHRMLCPALVFAGEEEKARRSLAQMRAAYPEITIAQVTSALPMPKAVLDQVADSFRRLDMPEGDAPG